MYSEAAAELNNIDPVCLAAPEVLSVRLWVYAGLQDWGMMQSVAKRLSSQDPKNAQWAISAAYAARRAADLGRKTVRFERKFLNRVRIRERQVHIEKGVVVAGAIELIVNLRGAGAH